MKTKQVSGISEGLNIKGKDDKHGDLKSVILSFGGDEEDYDLVKDIDSDDEKLGQSSGVKTDVSL